MYTRTLEGIPRTKNSVEGYNHRFNKLLGNAHVNDFEFLDELLAEERHAIAQRNLHEAAERTEQKKKQYTSITMLDSIWMKKTKTMKATFGNEGLSNFSKLWATAPADHGLKHN